MKTTIRAPKNKDEWEKYFQIRYLVLRQPWSQPKGSEKTNNEETHNHFAIFINKKMVGVLRMDEINKTTVQLRFMAVLPSFQKMGLGEQLIEAAENKALSERKTTIFLHARQNAVGFYQKAGYTIVGQSHLLYGSIQHFEMEKTL